MKKLLVGILLLTAGAGVGIAGAPCAIVPMPAGWSMIANPCNGGVIPLNTFLTGMPEGTEVYKLAGITYDYDLYLDGAWDGGGVITLGPGEGAYMYLPVAAVLGYGGAPLVGPIATALPAGMSIQSPPSGLGMALFPAADGDMIFRFVNAINSWNVYVYFDGVWDPAPPAPAVGESFWVFKTAPAVWVQ
jgi:hypothetical protein